MNSNQKADLAALAALGNLEPEERVWVEGHLTGDRQAQARRAEYSNTLATLIRADAARDQTSAPAPALKARVLASIAQTPQQHIVLTPRRPIPPPAAPKSRAEPTRRPGVLIPFLPWAIAACLALVAGWASWHLGFRSAQGVAPSTGLAKTEGAPNQFAGRAVDVDALRQAEQEIAELKERVSEAEAARVLAEANAAQEVQQRVAEVVRQRQAAEASVAEMAVALREREQRLQDVEQLVLDRIVGASSLEALKVVDLAPIRPEAAGARGVVVWSPDESSGVIVVSGMPDLRADQDYQIWIIDPAFQNPVNGGVFVVDQNGSARLRFTSERPDVNAVRFAVSRERKGGVPVAQNPLLVMSPPL